MPIIAPQGVHDVIRRDDPIKEQILRPMFGDEWAARRTFPSTAVQDGERVTFDGVAFTVIDLGPSESPHDSPSLLGDDERTVFLGDQIYDHTHCYIERADWSDPGRAREAVIEAVKTYLPGDDLQFLMELSIDPVAAQLGLLEAPPNA